MPFRVYGCQGVSIRGRFLHRLMGVNVFAIIQVLARRVPQTNRYPTSTAIGYLSGVAIRVMFNTRYGVGSGFLYVQLRGARVFFGFFLQVDGRTIPMVQYRSRYEGTLLFYYLGRHREFFCYFYSIICSMRGIAIGVSRNFPYLCFFVPCCAVSAVFLRSLDHFSLF